MSEKAPDAPEAQAHTRAEEDVVNTGKIVAVGVAAIAIFVAGSVVSTWVLTKRREELLPQGPPPIPAEAGQAKIGMAEQQLFENMRRAQRMREEQESRLGSYGWVNRGAGTIHIPIQEAMRRVAEGAQP